jgi:DNA-binding transcriptional regulator YiaG
MKKTSLQSIHAIEEGLKAGKSYEDLAHELHLTLRVVRKWGQVIKKGVS